MIVGRAGEVTGYTINKQEKITKKSWNIQIPISAESRDLDEVSSIWIDKEYSILYAGCGDNNVYVASLEDGKIIRKLAGHQDYLHSVHGIGSKIVTASEDGSVKIWDKREKEAVHTIEPYLEDDIKRPEMGKWQGSATITNDWMVCGGVPELSL